MRPARKSNANKCSPPATASRSAFRFQFRPERKGVNFYQVHAFAAADEKKAEQVAGDSPSTSEQTLANNSRLVVIDQGGGPYRVLYVSGRPDWEFKFLRRALEEDDQLELAGLVRIARRQPKFDFRNSRTQSTSPLFDGFDHPDAETAERSDQPVLIRLGTKLDGVELRDGFPKTADELYRYHAIILDDLEAGFFTPDQLALLRNFVSQRGGGLLDAGRARFVCERQVRPHAGRRALARLSESVRAGARKSRSIAWCSREKAGCSPGFGCEKRKTKSASGWRGWSRSTR